MVDANSAVHCLRIDICVSAIKPFVTRFYLVLYHTSTVLSRVFAVHYTIAFSSAKHPPSPTYPVNYPLNPLLYPLSPTFDTPLVITRIWTFQKHLYIPI